ncbi:MAG: thioredoxin family protein [Proteobacteria bacterium]|nr:thioredoxin family protein [Pseudomonadota bacterium]
MQNRRKFLTGAFAAGLGLAALPLTIPLAAPALARYDAPEGFHHQDWFMPTTFDLRRDQEAAKESGKMLTLLWEQVGCTYCKQMHEVAFQYEEITDLAKANFYIVQMDMRGDREFIDLGGEKNTEAKIARASRVQFTPTTQFFGPDAKEAYRMPGYANPPVFKAVYEYVIEKGYANETFQEWVKKKIAKG